MFLEGVLISSNTTAGLKRLERTACGGCLPVIGEVSRQDYVRER